ncbi:MAG TPA: hypothetical protein VFM39_01025 [bacterium]|nr:hypothetical protein [bacterium]
MRPSSKARPWHDPRKIFTIHADQASGLTPLQIAAKHDLPPATVQGFLRARGETCTLASPYGIQRSHSPTPASVQVYWLGFIAAAGRVSGQSHLTTLVLHIHPGDAPHVQTLIQDLMIGHVTCEFADSSLYGRQAYVRDRQLAEQLLQWGISATSEDGSIPIEFIPESLIGDFVRGYLEGSRYSPPFGGLRHQAPSPRSLRSLVLVGPVPLVEGLNRVLHSVCGARGGVVRPFGTLGLAQVVFSQEDGIRVLEHAYRRPSRSMPRAARFAAWFGHHEGRRPRRSSGERN